MCIARAKNLKCAVCIRDRFALIRGEVEVKKSQVIVTFHYYTGYILYFTCSGVESFHENQCSKLFHNSPTDIRT